MHSIEHDRTCRSQFVALAGQELVALARFARPHLPRDLHVHAPLILEIFKVGFVELEQSWAA